MSLSQTPRPDHFCPACRYAVVPRPGVWCYVCTRDRDPGPESIGADA